MTLTDGVKKLRVFLEENRISKRKTAIALKVSLPTVLDWLRGRNTPTQAHRQAIEIWTKRQIVEADWESAKERKAAAEAKTVEPFEPATGAHGGGE